MDKLLKLISENANFTSAELAAMLGEPEDAVKAKIKDYEEKGVIKGYQAILNSDYFEDNFVEALIELKVAPKKETGFDEIASQIMSFDEVSSMYLMAGSFDFAVFVTGKTMQDVASFVARKISCVDGVIASATHFMLKTYKIGGVSLVDDNPSDGRGMVL